MTREELQEWFNVDDADTELRGETFDIDKTIVIPKKYQFYKLIAECVFTVHDDVHVVFNDGGFDNRETVCINKCNFHFAGQHSLTIASPYTDTHNGWSFQDIDITPEPNSF